MRDLPERLYVRKDPIVVNVPWSRRKMWAFVIPFSLAVYFFIYWII